MSCLLTNNVTRARRRQRVAVVNERLKMNGVEGVGTERKNFVIRYVRKRGARRRRTALIEALAF